jgi:hypothetical protein
MCRRIRRDLSLGFPNIKLSKTYPYIPYSVNFSTRILSYSSILRKLIDRLGSKRYLSYSSLNIREHDRMPLCWAVYFLGLFASRPLLCIFVSFSNKNSARAWWFSKKLAPRNLPPSLDMSYRPHHISQACQKLNQVFSSGGSNF